MNHSVERKTRSCEFAAMTEADRLSRTVRVFCLVMTTPMHHSSRAVHVVATWGKRCTKIMFISEGLDKRLPILHVDVPTGRQELTEKHRLAWDVVYKYVCFPTSGELWAMHYVNGPLWDCCRLVRIAYQPALWAKTVVDQFVRPKHSPEKWRTFPAIRIITFQLQRSCENR